MGTLGCINDMLQRDKENRELRKRNRERLTDTYHRLLDTGKETDLSQMTVEKMEDIRQKVESVEGVTTATINLVFEPEWDKDMMSGIRLPILRQCFI